MSPTFRTKKGVRLRYYATPSAARKGAGTVRRVSATQIEELVVDALRKLQPDEVAAKSPRELVHSRVSSVTIYSDRLAVDFRAGADGNPDNRSNSGQHDAHDDDVTTIEIPWTKRSQKRPREIAEPASGALRHARPIQAKTRATLLNSIAQGRRWVDELVRGDATSVEQIAKREGCGVRQANLTISLAFLAPLLVKAVVDGRLRRGISIGTLRDGPASWAEQRASSDVA